MSLQTAKEKADSIARGTYKPKKMAVTYCVPPRDDIIAAFERHGYHLSETEIDKALNGTTIKLKNIHGRRGGSYIPFTPYDVRRLCQQLTGKDYHRPASEFAFANRLPAEQADAMEAIAADPSPAPDPDPEDFGSFFDLTDLPASEPPPVPAAPPQRDRRDRPWSEEAAPEPEAMALAKRLARRMEPQQGEVRFIIIGTVAAGDGRSLAKCLGEVEQMTDLVRATGQDVEVEVALPPRMAL